jgi:hypothetical protein
MDQKSNHAAEIWQWDRWRTGQKDKNVRIDRMTDPESHTRSSEQSKTIVEHRQIYFKRKKPRPESRARLFESSV